MSPWFLFITLLTVLQMLRMNFLIATIRSQYESMLGSERLAKQVNTFFDIALPIGGVATTPFIGLLLDNFSVAKTKFDTKESYRPLSPSGDDQSHANLVSHAAPPGGYEDHSAAPAPYADNSYGHGPYSQPSGYSQQTGYGGGYNNGYNRGY